MIEIALSKLLKTWRGVAKNYFDRSSFLDSFWKSSFSIKISICVTTKLAWNFHFTLIITLKLVTQRWTSQNDWMPTMSFQFSLEVDITYNSKIDWDVENRKQVKQFHSTVKLVPKNS